MINYEQLSHSIETEKSVYACLLLESKLSKDIVELTKEADYYDKKHKVLFRAVNRLYLKNKVVDYATLSNELKRTKDIDKVGEDYLIDLSTSIVKVENFKAYMDIIVEKAEERRIQEKFLIFERDKDKYTFEERKQWLIENINDSRTIANDTEETFSDQLDDWYKSIKDTSVTTGMPTLYKKLDDMLNIKEGNLIIISARPGCGKSTLALNFVDSFCRQNFKTFFVSLEMNSKEIINKFISDKAEIECFDLDKKENLPYKELERYKEQLKNYPLTLFAKGSMQINHLCNYAKILKKNDKLDSLVVDYVGLIGTDKFQGQRHNQIGLISRQLKQLAMDLKIPAILLAQLNRNVAGQDGKLREPVLTDLKESGSLEEDANVVIFLHTTDKDLQYDNRNIKLILAKNRGGRLGHINFQFQTKYSRFREVEWNDSAKGYDKWKVVPLKELNDIKKAEPKIQDKMQVKEYKQSELPF